jgi:hypothetical protein
MARPSRTQSNAQESEAQRSDAKTSADATSLVSGSASSVEEQSRLSVEEEQAEIQASVDRTLGKEDEPAGEKIKVKTLGPYLIHDPTTGDTVEEDGSEVRLSGFIKDQLEAGRIAKA